MIFCIPYYKTALYNAYMCYIARYCTEILRKSTVIFSKEGEMGNSMKKNFVYWVKEGRGRLKSLNLTYCCEDDADILSREGVSELRRLRVARLLEQAREQGATLSYRDLSLILLTSKSTLKRDLRTSNV